MGTSQRCGFAAGMLVLAWGVLPVAGCQGFGADDDPGCTAEQTLCGDQCVQTSSDPRHCGGCGAACGIGEVCTAGSCHVVCNPGLTECEDGCRNLRTDAENCGACGAACEGLAYCSAGTCVPGCASTLLLCDGVCVDPAGEANCGRCGNVCQPNQVCNRGTCDTQSPTPQHEPGFQS